MAGVNGDRFAVERAAERDSHARRSAPALARRQPVEHRLRLRRQPARGARAAAADLAGHGPAAEPRRPSTTRLPRAARRSTRRRGGPSTPVAPGSLEVVLRPFPATLPNTEVSGPVTEVRSGGATPIPPDGAVLVARGTAATTRLRNEAPRGRHRTRAPHAAARLGRRRRCRRRRACARPRRQGGVQRRRGVRPQPARAPRAAHGRGAARRRADRARRGRRPPPRLLERHDELRARARRSSGSARSRAPRSTAAALRRWPSTGSCSTTPSGAERPVSEALLMVYSGIHAPLPTTSVVVAERRQRRREPDARLQARPAVDGDGEPRRARRLDAARLLRPGRARARIRSRGPAAPRTARSSPRASGAGS